MQFDNRKTATILAALRYWQRHQARAAECGMRSNTIPEDDILTNGGTLKPLDGIEIDALCEEINFEPKEPSITIRPEAWVRTGSDAEQTDDDPASRLLTSIVINGTHMHLEAYAVKEADGETHPYSKGDQIAADQMFEDDVATFQGVFECAFDTTEINGRDYILIATPHGA